MTKRRITAVSLTALIILSTFACLGSSAAVSAESREADPKTNKNENPFLKFLKDIDYSSRLKFEYDTNIFLTEDGEDFDWKEIFTQTLFYQLIKGDHYFQWGYSGNYAYYDKEAKGVLGHTANVLYSYRPFEKLSFGFRDDYNWLQDSKMAAVIGDRVLALGYTQNVPSFQLKYEIDPKATFTLDVFHEFLDVRNGDNDDFIDHYVNYVSNKIDYNLTPENNLVGFFGNTYRNIQFDQIDQKSSTSNRAFVGLTEKFPNLFHWTQEVGFENIYFDNSQNNNDDNIDFKTYIETVFSLYTKLRLSFSCHAKNPSYRAEYTQYASNVASLNLSHVINPKTTLFFDYSFEYQKFDDNDALIGQPTINKRNHIHNLRLMLSRSINSWLVLDFRYDYSKRDSDFAEEGYTDNKISTAITAKY
ncbi:MAG TPA: hypothetical protein PL155_07020 [Candidatus Omnitrophota bacterium]|nr:hypothetical protein [Candidatus Omnitrophota bacterium]HPD85539.1 hypothetical protein [Candidatus Omnitrophota bacterium]HRZ04421.1 hypothetical protein [Candidatus Omnitrophota bacterium]